MQSSRTWPFMKVPVVSTAALQAKVMPKKVLTPQTSSLPSTSTLVTMPAAWNAAA